MVKWREKSNSSRRSAVVVQEKAFGSTDNLKLTCWNCRGLSSSLPYICSLIEEGSRILVVSEHWLWPYDLYKLGEIHTKYDAIGKSDGRLNPGSGGSRGFGDPLAQGYWRSAHLRNQLR